MLGIFIPFLALVGLCQGFHEQVSKSAAIKEEPMDNEWASLLRQQELKLASQLTDQEAITTSLLKQEAKWASFLRNQETETASTGTELENIKRLFRQQEQKIVVLEQKLIYQESLLSQQQKKLLDQEDLLRQQGQTLSHQESLLQEQGARLSYQEGLLQQQGTTTQEQRHRYFGPSSFLDESLRHSTNMSQPKTPLTGTTSDSTSYDVIPRSDDVGPWEAVMSHISQQVTEMGADIQALKNSNRQQDLAIQDAQSSTFVHWGSSTCINLSHTVYSGVVGGSWCCY